MLEYHKAMKADLTIAAMPVPMEEATPFWNYRHRRSRQDYRFPGETEGTQE